MWIEDEERRKEVLEEQELFTTSQHMSPTPFDGGCFWQITSTSADPCRDTLKTVVNCPWDQVLPQDIKHTDSWANGRSFILIIPKANQPLTLHDYYYIILLLLFLFSMYTCTCRCTIDVLLKMGTVAPYCQSLFLFSNCVPCSLFHSLAILKA